MAARVRWRRPLGTLCCRTIDPSARPALLAELRSAPPSAAIQAALVTQGDIAQAPHCPHRPDVNCQRMVSRACLSTVKEHLTGWAVSVGSGLGTALAGAP